jgi:hypothetical protein
MTAGLAMAFSSIHKYTNRQFFSVILGVLCGDEFPDPLPQRAQRDTEETVGGEV